MLGYDERGMDPGSLTHLFALNAENETIPQTIRFFRTRAPRGNETSGPQRVAQVPGRPYCFRQSQAARIGTAQRAEQKGRSKEAR